MQNRLRSRARVIQRLLLLLALLGLATLGAGAGWFLTLRFSALAFPANGQLGTIESTKIYDRHGRLLYEVLHPEAGMRSAVPLAQIPLSLRQATLATEDANYYSHPGVDFKAIARALLQNLRRRSITSGASTITQQVVRMLELSPEERGERTLSRKLKEMVLALRLSRKFTKEQVLELYLNHIYYGNLAWGVEAASYGYFGKPVHGLDLAECALLAGLPQAPSLYDPFRDFPAAKARQRTVLQLMVKGGYISPEGAELAAREELLLNPIRFPIRAPHFVMYVRRQLEERYGEEVVARGGLKVYTTLDLELTELAEGIIRRQLAKVNQEAPISTHRVQNAALIALDPLTGQILAMVGSPDYFDPRISGALNATLTLRQPGSSIKAITYAAAFSRGDFTPATVLYDVPISFLTQEGEPYRPVNYDRIFHGPLSLRQALATSSNVVTVKLLDRVGVGAMLDMAKDLGVTTLAEKDRYGLAVTLGGGEVSLLELTQAYGVFAAGGLRREPVAVLRVEDAQGRVLEEWKPTQGERVLSPQVAYLLTHILSDDRARIPAFGEASLLKLSRPAAAKTGTTGDWRDNWTIGYTPELAAGVWIGNADNSPMYGLSGVSGAAPVWHDFMEEALKGIPRRDFPQPEGLMSVEICPESGMLPSPHCPHRVSELFIAGTEPQETCTLHRPILIHTPTGCLAGEGCPREEVEARVYGILPLEAQAWARGADYPQPPSEYAPCASEGEATAKGMDQAPHPAAGAEVAIFSPVPGSTFALSSLAPASSQRIAVSARVRRQAEVDRIQFWVDGVLWREFGSAPFRAFWQLRPGEHTFTAILFDRMGHGFVSEPISIQVLEGDPNIVARPLPAE